MEVFFFDRELGVQPPPPGKVSQRSSPEYSEWRARAQVTYDSTQAGTTSTLRFRLHEAQGRPLQNVPYRVTLKGEAPVEDVSSDGWVELEVPPALCLEPLTLEWGEKDADGEYPNVHELVADCGAGTEEQQARAKMHNAGIPNSVPYEEAVSEFQWRYRVPEDGLTEDGDIPPPAHAHAPVEPARWYLRCDPPRPTVRKDDEWQATKTPRPWLLPRLQSSPAIRRRFRQRR